MIRSILSKSLLTAALGIPLLAVAATPVIEVYKSASCGCCEEWVKHLREAGLKVNTHDVENPALYRQKGGIPDELGSCHTGMVRGYALEGHVPASEVKRLLAEKPKAKGLTVPGMPVGSPGMEGPRKDAFDVLLVQANGRTSVYKHYN